MNDISYTLKYLFKWFALFKSGNTLCNAEALNSLSTEVSLFESSYWIVHSPIHEKTDTHKNNIIPSF